MQYFFFFFITHCLSSESFRGLRPGRFWQNQAGTRASFSGGFLLLPEGGSWHTDCPQTDPPPPFHASTSFLSAPPGLHIPSYTPALMIFLAPGPFPEELHTSFLSLKIFCLPQGWEQIPLSLITSQPSLLDSCCSYCLCLSIPSTSAFLRSPGVFFSCQLLTDQGFGELRF